MFLRLFFFSLFSLPCSDSNGYCVTSQFTESFVFPWELFISVTIFFNSKIAICLFFISSIHLLRFSVSLLRCSFFFFVIISLKSVHNYALEGWIMTALRYLSNNTDISVSSVLESLDCLFSLTLTSSWFLWWWMIFFFIETWTFSHYVLGLWMLFKPPVLVDFMWHDSSQGRRECHLISGDRSPSSPLGLWWYPNYRGAPRVCCVGVDGSSSSPCSLKWHNVITLHYVNWSCMSVEAQVPHNGLPDVIVEGGLITAW